MTTLSHRKGDLSTWGDSDGAELSLAGETGCSLSSHVQETGWLLS